MIWPVDILQLSEDRVNVRQETQTASTGERNTKHGVQASLLLIAFDRLCSVVGFDFALIGEASIGHTIERLPFVKV